MNEYIIRKKKKKDNDSQSYNFSIYRIIVFALKFLVFNVLQCRCENILKGHVHIYFYRDLKILKRNRYVSLFYSNSHFAFTYNTNSFCPILKNTQILTLNVFENCLNVEKCILNA